MPTVTPNIYFETTVLPSTVKCMNYLKFLFHFFLFIVITAPDGTNLRRTVYNEIKKLVNFMLLKRENDTKSLIKLANIIRVLMHVKGVDAVCCFIF